MEADFFIGGTAPALGGVIDMTIYPTNFTVPGVDHFFICIETAAPIVTKLRDGSAFTITLAQATAYLGTWYPVALSQVTKAGTTGTFSFGY